MLYYIYSLMTRVLSLEKRDINSNFCAQSVKQDLNRRPPSAREMPCSLSESLSYKVRWYHAGLHSCISLGVWKAIEPCYQRSPEFLYFPYFYHVARNYYSSQIFFSIYPSKDIEKLLSASSQMKIFICVLFLFFVQLCIFDSHRPSFHE